MDSMDPKKRLLCPRYVVTKPMCNTTTTEPMVVLYVAFAFSELYLICVFSVFFICLLSCIFQREPTCMTLSSLIVLMCR